MEQKIHISLDDRTRVQVGGGSSDYNELSNKPQINGVTLENNKTAQELNLATNADLERYFDFYFKSVDYVFAGINPELELLENPVQVVINSEGRGYVNLDYPLDLVEGKNYHIKATIGKLDGSVEEYENDIVAQRNENQPPIILYVKYDDNRNFTVVDKAKLTPTGGTEADENASAVMASDEGEVKVWSYVTFTSIVQKEKTIANLLKEPLNSMVSAENPVPIGYKLGLEVGKAYDIEFSIDGVIRTVTNISINMADLGEEIPANVLMGFVVQDTTKSEMEATKGQFYVYDGINAEMQEAENSVYIFICQDSNGNAVTAQVLSIKENTAIEEFVTPLELNFDNSTTIQTPGGEWCNGFIYKKSEFLKSIKDGDIVRITMDMFTTFNGEEFRFNDVKIEETAFVDNEGLYLDLSLYNYTDDLFPTMYITDSNASPSDYVFVGVALGEANINCKIKSMEISHGLLQSDVTLTTTKTSQNLNYSIGLKVNEYYDINFYATDSSGGIVSYKDGVYAKTNTDGGVSLSIVRGSTNAIELEFVVIDGVSLNDSGQVTIDANSSAIRVSQFGNFVSVTVTSLLLSNK